MRIKHSSPLIAAVFLIGCSSYSSPKTTNATAASQTDKAPATADTSTADAEAPSTEPMTKERWKALKGKQRGHYMKKVVVPAMAKVFQEHDAKKYAKVKCTLCHGDKAMDGEFEMPNPDLHQLSKGFESEKAKHPKMLDFMAKRVVPEMAKLLGQEPYNPATHKGFGCLACHTMKK